MYRFLPLLAVFAVAAAPAAAQTAAPQQPAEKPKTVTKVVCERASVEETTGSRLGSAPKVCKKIVVPAESGKTSQKGHAPSQSGHAH